MKFIYVQLSYQQDLISCAHLVVFHPSSAPQSFPCRLPSYSVPKTVLVQPLVLIKNSNMPFSTFFTSSLPTRSSGRAAISLLVLLLSGAHAQDRTTEAGEAQIKGVLVEARWMKKQKSSYSWSSRRLYFKSHGREPPSWAILCVLENVQTLTSLVRSQILTSSARPTATRRYLVVSPHFLLSGKSPQYCRAIQTPKANGLVSNPTFRIFLPRYTQLSLVLLFGWSDCRYSGYSYGQFYKLYTYVLSNGSWLLVDISPMYHPQVTGPS